MNYNQHETRCLPEEPMNRTFAQELDRPCPPWPRKPARGPDALVDTGQCSGGRPLLVGHGAALADETGMAGAPIFDQSVQGDFVVAGSSTRQFGVGTAQANTFNLTVAASRSGAPSSRPMPTGVS